MKASPGLILRGPLMYRRKARKGSGTQAGSTETLISKSASAAKPTSSRSGMPAQTVVTAKPKPDHKTVAVVKAGDEYMHIANKIIRMSRLDFLESLRRAGIITAKGTLQAKYKKK